MFGKMSASYSCLLCLLVFYIRPSINQFMPVGKKPSRNACEGASKTALVEQFFNVIFSEFHNSPPVCVCVQMCADQPTYCYPNGCLKKVDNKKKSPDDNRPAPVTNIQNSESSNTLFLIDDKNNYINVLNEHAGGDKHAFAEKSVTKDIRPDPFKDRYKTVFKYKRIPIVELRYNLREQVKNMKSDKLKIATKDVSKTRWPNGNHMFNEQQIFKAHEKKNKNKQTNTAPENTKLPVDGNAYTSKYFKRDLRRNHKDDDSQEGEDVNENPDPLDNKNFSIETLIENLIGNHFGGKRDTDIESNNVINNSTDVTNSALPVEVKETTQNVNKTKDEVTCIVSMNMTNQNLDENKYTENNPLVKERMDKWKNYTFNEMIAVLAKRIEKQNNTSMEMMRQTSRHNIVAALNTTMPLQVQNNLKAAENASSHKSLLDEIQTVIITRNQPKNATYVIDRKKKTND